MVSLKELEQIVSISRERGLKIVIRLKRSKNSILIDKEVKAIDEFDKIISWAKAFPIPPNQVIDSYGINVIEIYCKNNLIKQFKSWQELLKNIDKLPICFEE